MIQAAVTRLATLPLLAVLSCTGTQQAISKRGPAPAESVSKVADPKPRQPAADSPPPSPTQPGRVTRIMLGDLFQLQQENRALIFDVRPSFVYQLGHIPGAVNWPKAGFNTQLSRNEARIAEAKAAKKPVVLYCVDFACPDARTVATWLSARGHSVAVLEGGWDAWKTGGLPAE